MKTAKRLIAATSIAFVLGAGAPAMAQVEPPQKADQLCITLWLFEPIPICIPLI